MFFSETRCTYAIRRADRGHALFHFCPVKNLIATFHRAPKKTKNSHRVTHAQGVHNYVINLCTTDGITYFRCIQQKSTERIRPL